MDIITLIDTALTVIGATVTLLAIIAPLTKATWDDKLLLALKRMFNGVKLNKSEGTVLIQVKK